VPLTADAKLFAEAVTLGSEVIWLHCCGERFADPAGGRPKGSPRMKQNAPTIPAAGEIPGAPEPLPEGMDYDPAKRRLTIGKGYVENVTPEMWSYEVSGMNVLRQWLATAVATAAARSSATAVRPRRWIKSNPITGCRSTPAT
jgi:hypothetical protein